jgi:hypothetical protein
MVTRSGKNVKSAVSRKNERIARIASTATRLIHGRGLAHGS